MKGRPVVNSSANTHSAGNDDGLRERKRAALHATIERAAIDLALEHGYDHLTVDMICEASMISPRTFFNYFGSKEAVILGARPPMPSEDEIEAFAHKTGSDVLGDFVTMITASIADRQPDPELFRSRRALIMRTPELFIKETARMGEFDDEFVRIILTRLETGGRTLASEPDLADEARMIAALTGGVMHYTMRKWFDGDTSIGTRELLQGSIALIRRITGGEQSAIHEEENEKAK